MELSEASILVVGGSGILGGLISRQLAEAGAKVYATCSSQVTASKIPVGTALNLMVDLANPQSIEVLANYLLENTTLNGIVLAAGRVGFGSAELTSSENSATLMQINYLGQAHLVSRLLPLLAKSEKSFVLGITGVVAEQNFLGMSAYTASKVALSSWLTSLRMDAKKSGLKVIEASPGHTETGLAERPLFGQAPKMPTGMEPNHVAKVIIQHLRLGSDLIPSTAF